MTTKKTIPNLITVGVIVAEVKAPLHRVLHVLSSRPHIHPAAKAGRFRLYSRDAIAMVRHELSAIDARRQARKAVQDGR